jgi:hypothetical protein
LAVPNQTSSFAGGYWLPKRPPEIGWKKVGPFDLCSPRSDLGLRKGAHHFTEHGDLFTKVEIESWDIQGSSSNRLSWPNLVLGRHLGGRKGCMSRHSERQA